MTADLLRGDAGYRRWLAARPGLWLEVGVFDDAAVLVTVMAERRALRLPRMAALRSPRAGRVRHRSPGAGYARYVATAGAEARP